VTFLKALTEWFCWNAWNYARKRAISREQWHPKEAEQARGDITPDQARVIGNEARQVLESPHFLNAWDAVNAELDQVMLHCDPDNKDKAQRIAISKQLLHSIRQQFLRKMNDGYMAEVTLNEIERTKRGRVFLR
jgi:DNA-binding Xre family transcriptional regulator